MDNDSNGSNNENQMGGSMNMGQNEMDENYSPFKPPNEE
jgi:hypothetical protein